MQNCVRIVTETYNLGSKEVTLEKVAFKLRTEEWAGICQSKEYQV